MKPSEYLENQHPYPKDVFTEPSKEEMTKAIKLLSEAGFNETRIFAHMARIGYESAIYKLKENETVTN